MGYSEKIGPVYFGDRDTAVSPHKLDEIESEVRRFVWSFSVTRMVTGGSYHEPMPSSVHCKMVASSVANMPSQRAK